MGWLQNENGLGEDIVEIQPSCVVNCSIGDIYVEGQFDLQDLEMKAILCPKNKHSLSWMNRSLARFPVKASNYYSADSFEYDDEEE